MKAFSKILILMVVLAAASKTYGQSAKIVSGTTNFSVKYVLGTCNGTFDAPKGQLIFDEKKPEEASFNINITANSFKTGNASRDKDMKSEKYFDAAKYPEMNFKSTKIEKKGTAYQATGTLKIRGVSKTVTLPFTARMNTDGSYALSSAFEINRLDYKIGEKDWKLKDVVTVNLKAVAK